MTYTFKDYMNGIESQIDSIRYFSFLKDNIQDNIEHFRKCYDMNINTVSAIIGLENIVKGISFNYNRIRRFR